MYDWRRVKKINIILLILIIFLSGCSKQSELHSATYYKAEINSKIVAIEDVYTANGEVITLKANNFNTNDEDTYVCGDEIKTDTVYKIIDSTNTSINSEDFDYIRIDELYGNAYKMGDYFECSNGEEFKVYDYDIVLQQISKDGSPVQDTEFTLEIQYAINNNITSEKCTMALPNEDPIEIDSEENFFYYELKTEIENDEKQYITVTIENGDLCTQQTTDARGTPIIEPLSGESSEKEVVDCDSIKYYNEIKLTEPIYYSH